MRFVGYRLNGEKAKHLLPFGTFDVQLSHPNFNGQCIFLTSVSTSDLLPTNRSALRFRPHFQIEINFHQTDYLEKAYAMKNGEGKTSGKHTALQQLGMYNRLTRLQNLVRWFLHCLVLCFSVQLENK